MTRQDAILTLIATTTAAVLLAAPNSESGIRTVERTIQALQRNQIAAAAAEFCTEEQTEELTQKLRAAKIKEPVLSVIREETGNANNEMKGRTVLYLFGELRTETGKKHFTADLVEQSGVWKLSRLTWAEQRFGSNRYAYQEDPKMSNSVESMTSGRTVVDGFMRLASQGNFDAALKCWSASEQAKPGKLDQLKKLVAANPARFQGFRQVVEGRTNFSFAHDANDQVTEVRAKGNMEYEGGTLKSFRMKLIAEKNGLRIDELSF